jgi:alkylation response protein AidB-like acyl-CoA dehydrogenase
MPDIIQTPTDAALSELCQRLTELGKQIDQHDAWPAEQLQLCGEYGVYRWFLSSEWGGLAWNESDLLAAYLQLSAACLTTTFILTQRSGACQRLALAERDNIKQRWLPGLATGDYFATVGISHLSTSRRHLGKPVLLATPTDSGYVLDGYSPWVTGAEHADVLVVGATLPDGQQILAAVPGDAAGVHVPPPPRLVGLTASGTGEVQFTQVHIDHAEVLAGPTENVMQRGKGAGTGGLQTSTLALGHASASIAYLREQSLHRSEFLQPAEHLHREQGELVNQLQLLASGFAPCSNEELRTRANSLVLRASQAALAAAKGAGYVVGHPAGRWCREALFFLVWSCPQPVIAANVCELASWEW